FYTFIPSPFALNQRVLKTKRKIHHDTFNKQHQRLSLLLVVKWYSELCVYAVNIFCNLMSDVIIRQVYKKIVFF
ncbi:MAG: hypothetical protein ACK559_16465, partial [bacterium]